MHTPTPLASLGTRFLPFPPSFLLSSAQVIGFLRSLHVCRPSYVRTCARTDTHTRTRQESRDPWDDRSQGV